MLHTAGGLVGGDRLQVSLTLGEGAKVLMTSAAAGKVYRSAGEPVLQSIDIALQPGACLEWFPQETILFTGAHYRQQLRVSLAPGALWTGWDVVRLGRSARGETFATGSWRTNTLVTQAGKPLWVDPQSIAGGSELLSSPSGLRSAPVIGTWVSIGHDAPRSLIEACRLRAGDYGHVTESRDPSLTDGSAEFGVTRLMSGMLCRYRGFSTTQAKQWFEQVWGLVRQHHSQRPSCRPRVWP